MTCRSTWHNIQWSWIRWQNSEGKRFDELEELVFEFTIHNDVEPQGGGYGYYLMLGHTRNLRRALLFWRAGLT